MGILNIGSFTFDIFDYIILFLMIIGAVVGWKKGFVNGSKSLIMILGGLVGAAYLTKPLIEIVWNLTSWSFLASTAARIIAFVLTFAISMGLIDLVLKLFKLILDTLHLKFIDKIIGLVWGVFVVFALALVFIQLSMLQTVWNPMPMFDSSFFVQHLVPEYLNPTVEQLQAYWPMYWEPTKEQLKEVFN